ncbi:fasciclin domain-containing protein [Sphingorhabdus sp. Alg239-R122]|uniref:fasciclin domain-containing protein n=1 Tax=Sphingorhabdus sp. Alg239-R122 TaxID=2305989 RepID=UPI0013DC7C03|nr:fasciclin domain-containing protein [Sphingorhabdus sp. Alg239-R122]
MNKTVQFVVAGSVAALLAACGTSETTTTESDAVAEDVMPVDDTATGTSLVDVAQGNPDFSTLVQAMTAAGLGETLSGEDEFTMFAPNNAAFDKVGSEALTELMKEENRDKLTGILNYHVIPGRMKAADLIKMIEDGGGRASMTTVQGGDIGVSLDSDRVTLRGADGAISTVILTDVDASNGVIHAIDTVVMP